jgi:hypothetical protein
VLRAGWQWAAVEGPAELADPDDPDDGVDTERLRLLLREIFTAAGGTHDDFDAWDRAMAAERRPAILATRPIPQPMTHANMTAEQSATAHAGPLEERHSSRSGAAR